MLWDNHLSLHKNLKTMKRILFFITTTITLGIATFSHAQTLPSYLPTDGLVGWWPFNGNANDESGNGNHGTVAGAILDSDRLGILSSSYLFNGSNNYIQVANNQSLVLDSDFSISCWVKVTGLNTFNTFLSNASNNQASVSGWVWGYSNFSQPARLHFQGYPFLNNSTVSQTGNNLANNVWFNILVTYNKNIGSLIYYLNGQPTDTFSTAYNISNANLDLFIGNHFQNNSPNTPVPTNGAFTGNIDDIGIWNRALTPEEITALYTATPTNGGGGNNTASANVPQGISYQAVARNPQGQPLSNTALQVKFTLLANSLTGTTEYAELHSLTTNDLGLFTTAIGTGTPLSGTFANINWAGGNKYLKVEMDAGNGFVALGTQQLLSVPYSMRSNTSAKAGTIENAGLPVYSDNAAALAGGLVAGQMYRTGAGVLMVVY